MIIIIIFSNANNINLQRYKTEHAPQRQSGEKLFFCPLRTKDVSKWKEHAQPALNDFSGN